MIVSAMDVNVSQCHIEGKPMVCWSGKETCAGQHRLYPHIAVTPVPHNSNSYPADHVGLVHIEGSNESD